MKILGIHVGHDSSASLIIDGKIIAISSEERFTRVKNDNSFPLNSIDFCLEYANISFDKLDILAIPSKSFQNEHEVFIDFPFSNEKLSLKQKIKKLIKDFFNFPLLRVKDLPLYQKRYKCSPNLKIHYCEHHLAHASSAYYTSGFNNLKSLIYTMDGSGENVSVALWLGENNKITPLVKYAENASLGFFYGNATESMGWRHGSDEWKVMGLAPYGQLNKINLDGFYPIYENGILSIPHNYGQFRMWNDHSSTHFHGLEADQIAKRAKDIKVEDFAAEVQHIIEQQSLNFILPNIDKFNINTICCAGGSFLNIKLNQKIWDSGKIINQWIYPDAGDAGLSLGAALHSHFTNFPNSKIEKLEHLYYGPEFKSDEIKSVLKDRGLEYEFFENPAKEVAKLLSKNLAVGWFQGRMEVGPRALGGRSILMSPLRAENKDLINAKVKYREMFRPFCPAIIIDKANDYINNFRDERFMITSFKANENKSNNIPAVVHVDGTIRPQIVYKETNSFYYDVINEFGSITGEYVLLNTSFNVKGEPIVCSPRDAVRCFFDTGLDVLCIGNYIVKKPNINKNEI